MGCQQGTLLKSPHRTLLAGLAQGLGGTSHELKPRGRGSRSVAMEEELVPWHPQNLGLH